MIRCNGLKVEVLKLGQLVELWFYSNVDDGMDEEATRV